MATKSELIFRIPLYTTMIGMFSPLLASISGYVELEKVLSESILLLVYSMLLLKRKESIKFSYLQIFLYMTLLIVYLYHLFKGGIFGLYGVYSIFVLIYIYVDIFIKYGGGRVEEIKKGVGVIIFINVGFIFFENAFNLLGFSNFLVDVTNGRYRLDLYAPLSYLNLVDFSSANSLMLKAQGASVMLGLAVIWYLDPFKVNLYKGYKYLLYFSLLLYSIQFTTTSMIVAFSMIIFSIFFLPFNKLRMGLSNGVIYIVLLLFMPIIYKIIFFKFDGFNVNQAYIDVMHNTLDLLYSLDINALLFGIGGFGDGSMALDKTEAKTADFGLLMILIMGGGISFIVIITALFVYFYKGVSIANKRWLGYKKFIAFLLATLLVLTFGLTISVIHYTNILMPGGRQIYAFLIAGSFYCMYLLRIPHR